MYTSVLVPVFSVFSYCIFSYAQSDDNTNLIITKEPEALEPITIECMLTDIIVISAPVVTGAEVLYKLYNPKNESRKLDLSRPKYNDSAHQYELLKVKHNKNVTVITPVNNYKVFNVNRGQNMLNREDTFALHEKAMVGNDFMIGPVGVEDNGNWILSIFYNQGTDWMEFYQSISIIIIETVPALPNWLVLQQGETFNPRFAYSIPNLRSCELVVPKTTFDRFYDRDKFNMNNCGYVVKNITTEDSGTWKIIGIGQITYEAVIKLVVSQGDAKEWINVKQKYAQIVSDVD